jgi:hypothetical protein
MEIVIGVGLGVVIVAAIALAVPFMMPMFEAVLPQYLRYFDRVERWMDSRKRQRIDVTTLGDAEPKYKIVVRDYPSTRAGGER